MNKFNFIAAMRGLRFLWRTWKVPLLFIAPFVSCSIYLIHRYGLRKQARISIEAEMGNRNGRGWRVYKLESPVPETETSPRETQNESRKCNSKHWMEQWVYRRAWLVQLTCILNIVLQIDDGETRAENVHSIPGHMERPLNAWWIVNIQFPTDFYLLSRSLCCLTRWAVVSVERQYFAWTGN